jgi:hypothetical protein
MSERDEQVALIEWRDRFAPHYPALGRLFAIPNGGKRDVVTAARLKAEGVTAGVPDLCLPVARLGYHGLWIEMKTDGGRVSKEQRRLLAQLEADGYMTGVCYSWPEAARVIARYLGEPIPLPCS